MPALTPNQMPRQIAATVQLLERHLMEAPGAGKQTRLLLSSSWRHQLVKANAEGLFNRLDGGDFITIPLKPNTLWSPAVHVG